jgi:hypothetical protein
VVRNPSSSTSPGAYDAPQVTEKTMFAMGLCREKRRSHSSPWMAIRGTNRQELEGCVAQRFGATRDARGLTRLHRCGAGEKRPAHRSWKIPSPFQPSLRRGIHGEGTMAGSPAWNCSAWTLTS